MGRGLGIGLVLAGTLAMAFPAAAGPWTREQATAQFILKYEVMRAERGFDLDGNSQPLLAERRDSSLSLYAEYGLTDRLMLVLKTDWQSGSDAFVDYEGRGPLEIGLAWQVYRDPRMLWRCRSAMPTAVRDGMPAMPRRARGRPTGRCGCRRDGR